GMDGHNGPRHRRRPAPGGGRRRRARPGDRRRHVGCDVGGAERAVVEPHLVDVALQRLRPLEATDTEIPRTEGRHPVDVHVVVDLLDTYPELDRELGARGVPAGVRGHNDRARRGADEALAPDRYCALELTVSPPGNVAHESPGVAVARGVRRGGTEPLVEA